MPKLYFKHGSVNASKTANLLMARYNYMKHGKVITIKPAIDTRYGRDIIRSRIGLECKADVVLETPDQLDTLAINNVVCILVDEAQFLDPASVEKLRNISLVIPVMCYGLRTNHKTELFPGSKRLMELADVIEEIKSTCHCGKKSDFNRLLKDNGTGESIQLGDSNFDGVCYRHYIE